MNWDDDKETGETPSVFGGSTQSVTVSPTSPRIHADPATRVP